MKFTGGKDWKHQGRRQAISKDGSCASRSASHVDAKNAQKQKKTRCIFLSSTMHTDKSYKLFEFLAWTRRDIYRLIIIGAVPVVLYQLAGLKWLSIPWTAVALLGTATAFIVGFKNTQTYNRTREARQIWGEIVSARPILGNHEQGFH